jgi:hypothetical protein
MKKALLPICSILILSCTNSLDKSYSEQTIGKEDVDVPYDLDSSGVKLLMGSFFRVNPAHKGHTKMTYLENIQDAQAWKAEQYRIDAKRKALQEEAKGVQNMLDNLDLLFRG